MSAPAPLRAPLEGVRVLDFTQNLPGPYTSLLLASWGAQVIKVEPPGGDPARHVEPLFTLLNRGKRSVVLDLRDPASRPALEALVRWAHVILEGFRPGVMARLGCDHAAALALNPRVITCSISAFGQDGPAAARPGHDLDLQALTGFCHLERDGAGRPRPAVLPVADFSASLLCLSSILAALRDPQGGVHLDVSMGDALLSWVQTWSQGMDLATPVDRVTRKRRIPGPISRLLTRRLERERLYALPHYGLFRARDDRYLALGVVDEDRFWSALCEVVDLPGPLRRAPMPVRALAGPLIRPLLGHRIRTRDRGDWLARLQAAGVPATAVHRGPEEVRSDPHLSRRWAGAWPPCPLPGAVSLPSQAPGPGQDTASILAELGLTRPT